MSVLVKIEYPLTVYELENEITLVHISKFIVTTRKINIVILVASRPTYLFKEHNFYLKESFIHKL